MANVLSDLVTSLDAPRGRSLPPKVERCVRSVKRQGKGKVSAIKICQAAVGGKRKTRPRSDSLSKSSLIRYTG